MSDPPKSRLDGCQEPQLPFELVTTVLQMGGREWTIFRVKSIDEIMDHWAAKADDHIDIVDERFPYWAEIWPSSIAMASYILENPSLLESKKVLEIGCGLGLAGMAAAAVGAQVTVTDYIEDPYPLLHLNWEHNLGRSPDFRLLDWRESEPAWAAEVLLASDVAYETKAFSPLIEAFQKRILPDGIGLLSEPNRLMAKPFLNQLSEHFQVEKTEKWIDFEQLNSRVGIYQLSAKGESVDY